MAKTYIHCKNSKYRKNIP